MMNWTKTISKFFVLTLTYKNNIDVNLRLNLYDRIYTTMDNDYWNYSYLTQLAIVYHQAEYDDFEVSEFGSESVALSTMNDFHLYHRVYILLAWCHYH